MNYSKLPIDKLFAALSSQQKIKAKLLIIVSTFILLLFIVITTFSPFKDQLFQYLYPKPPSEAAGITYYVSTTGNNADGKTWTTAWNELANINWSVVQPGDTIVLDGGNSEMVYNSTLTIGKNGNSSSPITITLSDEAGRNGKAIIWGGRSTPITEDGSAMPPARSTGIVFGNSTYVTVDGGKWRGITVYGHNGAGVTMSASSSNLTLKNVEVYDNGTLDQAPGIIPHGNNNRLERCIVHDNGQDPLQAGTNYSVVLSNLTIYECWLYNGRPHSTASFRPFNYKTHSDGFQIWGRGNLTTTGVNIERSVLGPGLNEGVILGENVEGQYYVNNVTLKDDLIINAHTGNLVMNKSGNPSTNWLIENVTMYTKGIGWDYPLGNTADSGKALFNIYGTNHTVKNTIVYGGMTGVKGSIYFQNTPTLSGNFSYLTSSSIGTNADPQFKTNVAAWPVDVSLQTQIDADYTATNPVMAGKGSPITSVAQLLSLADSFTPQLTPAPTSSPLTTPAPTPTPLAFPVNQTIEAEQGAITSPFTITSATPSYISQNADTADTSISTAGKTTYTVNVPTAGSYIVQTTVNATSLASNSFFVNIDSEPTAPDMVWDIPLTSGFSSRAVSWRGSGTPDINQFIPKVFNLSAGMHTLIIRGREANALLDKISLVPYSTPTPTPSPTSVPTPSPTPSPTPVAAPSAPSNLSSANLAYNKVNLSWTSSTSPVGIAQYWIVRNGVTIASSATTYYSDTPLSPSTSYSYYVLATDTLGNVSLPSNTIIVSTPAQPDTTAPTTPTNLAATSVSSSQINLSWSASTDNIGVVGYVVYRNGVSIGNITTTSFGDANLSSSTTYSYSVKAYDASGNTSSSSNVVSATTQAPTGTGNIQGTVFSSAGGIIRGAKVVVITGWNRKTYYTNNFGVYQIPNLPGGSYKLNFSARSYLNQSFKVTVSPGITAEKNVTLSKR